MATKTDNKVKGINKVREVALKINKGAFEVSNIVVKDALSMSEKWQKIVEKAINGGFDLLEKQGEVLSLISKGAKEQYKLGKSRAQDLTRPATEAVSDLVEEAKEAVEEVTETVMEETKEALTTAKEVIAEVAEDTTEIVTEAKDTATEMVDNMIVIGENILDKSANKTGEAIENVQETVKKVTGGKLVSIKGIGAKTAEILNKAGINNTADLANADVEALKATLAEAGSRYKNIDPTAWIEAAKEAK